MAETVHKAAKLGIFISYSRDDLAFADQLDAALGLYGFATTIDRQGISGGEDWKHRLGSLIRDADTVVFVLSPSSARSNMCAWEVDEAVRLGKRIIPVLCNSLDDVRPPPRLTALDYIFFYHEPKSPSSGFGAGLVRLVTALETDLEWLREHTRLLQRASEWDVGGRPDNRLLSGPDVASAKVWAARRPKDAPEPTMLHLDFVRASEMAEMARSDGVRRQLEERERLVQAAEIAQREKAEASRRLVQRTLVGLATALVLAVVAGSLGLLAWSKQKAETVQKMEAEAQARRANAARQEAVKARNGALLSQSQFLTGSAKQQVSIDPSTAILLALEALPDEKSSRDEQKERPYWAEAEVALNEATRKNRERALLIGHMDPVRSLAVSADGSMIVTGSSDGTARIWDASTGVTRAVLTGHKDFVEIVDVALDGTVVVTSSLAQTDDSVRIWDSKTGKERAILKDSSGVYRLALSRDGGFVVGSKYDGVRLWDGKTGDELALLKGYAADSLALSEDGTFVVTGSRGDSTARIWELRSKVDLGTKTLRERTVLKGHAGDVLSVAISGDGTSVVTGSKDHTARIWDAKSAREHTVLKGHTGDVLSVAISGDGTSVVTGSKDHTARIWDAKSARERTVLKGHTGDVLSVAISGDGTSVVTGSNDRTARIWDAKTGKERAVLRANKLAVAADGTLIATTAFEDIVHLWQTKNSIERGVLQGHLNSVISAAVSPDGGFIVTGSKDHTARIWDAKTRKELAVLVGHQGDVHRVAVAPDGASIVTCSKDKTARIWDVKSNKERASIKYDSVCDVFRSSDRAFIFAGSSNKEAQMWDVSTETRRATFHVSPESWEGFAFVPSPKNMAISPDGGFIVVGLERTLAQISDADTGRLRVVVKGSNHGSVQAVAISPDSSFVVTGSFDNSYISPGSGVKPDHTARIWNAKTGRQQRELEGHEKSVYDVAISPDGSFVVTGSEDNTARIWDTKTGRERTVLRGHQGDVHSLAISSDSKFIVTGSEDRTLRIWDAETGVTRAILSGHEQAVRHVEISPAGDFIVSVSDDGTARVWSVYDSQALVDHAKIAVPRCLSDAQRQSFYLLSTSPEWCGTMHKWPEPAAFTTDLPVLAKLTAEVRLIMAKRHGINAWRQLFMSENPTDGLGEAEKAAFLAPDNAIILNTRGQIYLALGRFDDALRDFNTSIANGMESQAVYFGRGLIHEKRGDVELAISDYRKALSIDTKDVADARSAVKAQQRLEVLNR